MPKRGFNHKRFADVYAEVNVGALNCFEDGAEVTAESLIEAGLVKKAYDGISVLGKGDLTKKLTVKVTKYTESAKEKIEKAGGKAEVM